MYEVWLKPLWGRLRLRSHTPASPALAVEAGGRYRRGRGFWLLMLVLEWGRAPRGEHPPILAGLQLSSACEACTAGRRSTPAPSHHQAGGTAGGSAPGVPRCAPGAGRLQALRSHHRAGRTHAR